jgi:hypothetical protein
MIRHFRAVRIRAPDPLGCDAAQPGEHPAGKVARTGGMTIASPE